MKFLPLLATLAVAPCAAWAQKEYTPLQESDAMKLSTSASLYRHLADTASTKADVSLKKGDEVTVVGQVNHHWAAIKRTGFVYYMPQTALLGTGGGLADVLTIEKWGNEPMPINTETKQFTYEGVQEVNGVSKNDLFSRGFEWVARSYNSAQNVVQMQDKEAGKIIIKAIHPVYSKGYDAGTVSYTLSLYFKDGRYKYVLSDFVHKGPILNNQLLSGGALENTEPKIAYVRNKLIWSDIRRSTASKSRSLINDLQSAMALKAGKDPSDF